MPGTPKKSTAPAAKKAAPTTKPKAAPVKKAPTETIGSTANYRARSKPIPSGMTMTPGQYADLTIARSAASSGKTDRLTSRQKTLLKNSENGILGMLNVYSGDSDSTRERREYGNPLARTSSQVASDAAKAVAKRKAASQPPRAARTAPKRPR